jgi:hypothetical protein
METMIHILGWMVLFIIFLFLLDIIIYMLKTIFSISYKKLLAGIGLGFGFMAFKDWYKKNNVDLTKKKNIVKQ